MKEKTPTPKIKSARKVAEHVLSNAEGTQRIRREYAKVFFAMLFAHSRLCVKSLLLGFEFSFLAKKWQKITCQLLTYYS